MEALRTEMRLGVNAFLATTGIPKSTYYRRKRGTSPRQAPVQAQILAQVSDLSDEYPALGHRPIAALLNQPERQASDSTTARCIEC